MHLSHLGLTWGSTGTISQEHFVSDLPASKPIDSKNSFGMRCIQSPAHCYRLNYRARPQSVSTFHPHMGQRKGQVCAPTGGIRERNQGAFPSSMISPGGNCGRGGDIFSDCHSFPHFGNLLSIHHTAHPSLCSPRKGRSGCLATLGKDNKAGGWLALWPANEETISVWGAFLVPHNSKLTPKLRRQQLIFS